MPARRQTTTEISRDLLRVAAFILFDATVFHEVLAGAHGQITSLRRATTPLQSFLDDQWRTILDIDYAPVFTLARDVVQAFPSSPNTEAMLQRIVRTALGVVSSGVLLKHDFMGRVYHRLLLRTTGHFYATYYTSVPAAWLLASLAVRTPHPAWHFGSLGDIERFRLIDPACGSGTLLSAAYMAIKDCYICERAETPDLRRLHQVLVEHAIHGWDILDYASHLTLTTLAFHSNRATVHDSNIYTLPAGVTANGEVHLGSLDYLSEQHRLTGRGFTAPAVQRSLEGERERDIIPEQYDLVIMNPPFSRSAKPNIKFGYSTGDARRKMGDALRTLTRKIGASGIGQAGLGAYFMLLGLRLAESDGRIAVVIPRAMLSGVSWGKVRKEYCDKCEIEYVVSNYDPGSTEDGIEPWCWSENTNLGEVLIVARKTQAPADERWPVYVNLWNKPKNEVEALLVAHQVARSRSQLSRNLREEEWVPITLMGRTVGSIYRIPQVALERNWLAPCVFAAPELNALVLDLLSDDLRCVPLADLAPDMGVDIKQVKDHFAQTDERTTYPLVWGHQSVMNKIALARKHVGSGRAKLGAASRRLHRQGSASLLIAERPHLSTECLLAMDSPEAVLTTAFWEIRPRDDRAEVAILLWLNSTYGVLQYLACATSSMGDIFKMKKDQIAAMPVVDPERLDEKQCRMLLRQVRSQEFFPFAGEFARAAAGAGPRRALDDFLCEQLGLPALSRRHYELLARDPIITKQRL